MRRVVYLHKEKQLKETKRPTSVSLPMQIHSELCAVTFKSKSKQSNRVELSSVFAADVDVDVALWMILPIWQAIHNNFKWNGGNLFKFKLEISIKSTEIIWPVYTITQSCFSRVWRQSYSKQGWVQKCKHPLKLYTRVIWQLYRGVFSTNFLYSENTIS